MNENLGQVVLVKDINPGRNSSYPYELIEFQDRLYFRADDGENGSELWVSDGTAEGTQLIKDIDPENSSYPRNFIEFNDRLYFSADDGENGEELWVTDGTTEGTSLIKDIDLEYGSYPDSFIEFNDRLYFSAGDDENGRELWVSDGTNEGTQLLKDINPRVRDNGFGFGSSPYYFTEFNDRLYFTANNNLWVSDGTNEGTQLVKDVDPGTGDYFGFTYGSYPDSFTEFNDRFYFSGDDGENGRELWVSDGTNEGTQLLKDINPEGGYLYAYGSYPRNITEFNGRLYFGANDGSGRKLWVSDGTTEGTQLLKDINPRVGSYSFAYNTYLRNFTEFNDRLYFNANDGEDNDELWVTDGTAEGTQLVKDINPEGGSSPRNFTVLNDHLYFGARGENGEELWVTDGTAEGTKLVADINPGERNNGFANSSSPTNFIVFGDELFFVANNGETGRELFKLTINDDVNDDVNGDTLVGSNGSDSLVGGSGNDSLVGNNGQDTLDGGAGSDTLVGDNAKDSLVGGSGNDNLAGNEGKDTLDGGDGDDTLIDDNGSDSLIGGSGNDSLTGGRGRDILDGGDGDDTLIGGDGSDSLIGGSGNDSLSGGRGRDTLDGGAGSDTLFGGNAKDLFVLRAESGEDTITDFESGSDRLGLADNLQFEQLSFVGNTIQLETDVLATLVGIDTESLTADDFTII